jgi:hypothetical protein
VISIIFVLHKIWHAFVGCDDEAEIRSGDYTVYYSGGDRAERGVAIVVHKSM